MSAIVIPTGWSLYRNGNDEVIWQHTSHTAEAPVLWIIKSRPPKNGVLSYLHRLVVGIKDPGSEETRNLIVDVSVRNAPDQDGSAVASRMSELFTALATGGAIGDMTVTGAIPYA